MVGASNHKNAGLSSTPGARWETVDAILPFTFPSMIIIFVWPCSVAEWLACRPTNLRPLVRLEGLGRRHWIRFFSSLLFLSYLFDVLCCGGVASVSTHKLASLSSTRGSEMMPDMVLFFSFVYFYLVCDVLRCGEVASASNHTSCSPWFDSP